MTVSEEQMEKFRKLLKSEDPEDNQAPNFRPPLPVGGRTVYQCGEDIAKDAIYSDIAEKYESYQPSEEEEEKYESSIPGLTISQSEIMWRMVGISFICLFSVTLLVCCVGGLCVWNHWDRIFDDSNERKMSDMLDVEMDKVPPKFDRELTEDSHDQHQANVHGMGGTDIVHKI